MGFALALHGITDAVIVDATALMPKFSDNFADNVPTPSTAFDENKFIESGGPALMAPYNVQPEPTQEMSVQLQLDLFALQLGGIPISQRQPEISSQRRHVLDLSRLKK